MRPNKISFVFYFLFSLTYLFGGVSPSNEALFTAANAAYTRQAYSEAAEKYELLVSKNIQSAAIYYNLGNAYFKQKNWAKAILFYEKAKKINPTDAATLTNLETANAQLMEPVEAIKSAMVVRIWRSIRSCLSANSWAYLAIGMTWGLLISFLVWYYGTKPQVRKISFGVGIGLLSCFWLPWTMGHQQEYIHSKHNLAIIISPNCALLHSPDPQSQQIRDLESGIKVSMKDQIGTYIKVELPNGEQGWLNKNEIEII